MATKKKKKSAPKKRKCILKNGRIPTIYHLRPKTREAVRLAANKLSEKAGMQVSRSEFVERALLKACGLSMPGAKKSKAPAKKRAKSTPKKASPKKRKPAPVKAEAPKKRSAKHAFREAKESLPGTTAAQTVNGALPTETAAVV